MWCRGAGSSIRGKEYGMTMDLKQLPTYRDLPVDRTAPPGSSWGVFGPSDELGTVNLLTPDRVRRGAALVGKGRVFPLNWDLEKPDPPLLGREPMTHTILDVGCGTDDYYDHFYPQGSSQWDALSHIGHPQYGFYNGRKLSDFTGRPGSLNGIDNWARRGIVGRFVLADIERYRERHGRPIRQDTSDATSVKDLECVLAEEGVQLELGDILLLRFGWLGWYDRADRTVREELASYPGGMGGYPSTPGMDRGERTAEWLWDRHVAAVAADCPGMEQMPVNPSRVDQFLHYRLIPLLGIAIGEFFMLDDLAQDCADDGVYEGFFASAPLHKVGGSGSPANALAMK